VGTLFSLTSQNDSFAAILNENFRAPPFRPIATQRHSEMPQQRRDNVIKKLADDFQSITLDHQFSKLRSASQDQLAIKGLTMSKDLQTEN
jgi:hypothetical protein